MIRFAASLVAASLLAVSVPAAADGIPLEKRSAVIKKIKKKRPIRKKIVIERTVVVEEKTPAPPVVAAPPPPLPVTPVFFWVPGHWTWNSSMNMHVWVPGMHVRPPSPEEEQSLALWRIGRWIGIGRDD